MRERRVGRVALPARLVAGVVGAAALVTAASPVYAQDEESGGGEVLCELHDPRLSSPAGIADAGEGDGWWIVSAADGQDLTLSVERVGEDCNPRGTDEVFIDHQPRDPQALAVDSDGYLWVGDTGDATNRDWITVNQIDPDDLANNVAYRYVFPGAAEETEAFVIPPGDDKKPLFISSAADEATLYFPPGDNLEENTALENVGTVALPEGGSVTGAALNADGTKVALRTESNVYEYTVDGGDVTAALTGGTPVTTPIADPGTPEGIAYDADGNFNTLSSASGDDGTQGTITSYAPAAPAAEESSGEDEAAAGDSAAEEGPSLVDRILDLGFDTIVKILAAIAILGLLIMVLGIVVIRKYRKANGDKEEDATEMGFAAEESGFGKDDSYLESDPVDLGLDAGQPDPDLGQVARGSGVYGGGARQEPSGNVYGGARQEPSGNVYGAQARPEPSGNVYGAQPRPEPPAAPQAPGSVYGGAREEPQYGAFEGGGHGSVYDNAGPGQSFAARPPEPSGNVYGAQARPEPPAGPPSGNVYGAQGPAQGQQGPPQGQAPGSVYGAGNAERTPEADEGYWGPSDTGGSTYGRGR